MLIVAWVMSDPVNCELMGRLVMHRLSPFAEISSKSSSTGQFDWPMAIETHISYPGQFDWR